MQQPEIHMLWKLLGLQKKLDALFEDGWIRPGFVCNHGGSFGDWLELQTQGDCHHLFAGEGHSTV
jgi:hypothetical protein